MVTLWHLYTFTCESQETTLSQTPFSNLKLQTNLLENLSSLRYDMMTTVQAKSLPHILAGKENWGSKTGGRVLNVELCGWFLLLRF